MLAMSLVFELVLLLMISRAATQHPPDLERNASSYSDAEEALCHTVYLLNVVPYPDNDEMAGWDRGFELIPAGRLAAAHINNRSDILGGFKLELIDIDSEACGRSLVTDGQLGLFKNIMSTPCIAGVIGLFCSAVTELVLPLANHSMYGYTQLSSSTSPLLQNSFEFPYLFRTISSSEVFNLAMIAMMDYFDWSRVSVIYDSMGIYFDSTGNHFATLVNSLNKTLLSSTQILPSSSRDISSIFETLNNVASTIGYYSVTVEESAAIMCEAFKRNQLWRDGHVYVFYDRTFEELTADDPVTCLHRDMLTAVEGVFTLQYKLKTTQTSGLIAGISYETYHQEYLKELRKFAIETGMELEEGNEYANTLYDQVWAFALAMNNSLDEVRLVNGSFEDSYKATPKLREILTQKLKEVSFNGMTGQISFGQEQEVHTYVDIFQIRNGSAQLIGEYNSDTMNISFGNFDQQDVPDDMPETVQYLLPVWLGVAVLTVQSALLIMLIGNTVLLVYLRKSPEIKSSSFYISLIIMTGCFFLCISSVLHAVTSSFHIANTNVFTALCYMELWLSTNGLNFVIVPLLFRLLRIYHVFGSFRSTGKYWSDKYLLCYIFLLCSVVVILLTVWNAVDPLRFDVSVTYIRPHNSPPYYMAYAHCSGELTTLWIALTYSWIGLIQVVVLLLAIKTRRIKRKNYKDTKKVNAFVFSQSLVLLTFLPLASILVAINVLIGAFIFEWLAFFLVAFLCQIFIFMPKIFPVLLSSQKKQKPHVAVLARSAFAASLNYTDVSKV